jgi:hypothetical protein
MFARNPSRTVTGAAAGSVALLLLPVAALELLPEFPEEQPATSMALPATAAATTKILRIYCFQSLSI